MHGERQHAGLVSEDLRRSVSLVHIQIDHRNTARSSGLPQRLDRHRNVIEHAISRAFAAESMVRTSCQRPAPACTQCLCRCAQRSTHRSHRPANQLFGPRKANPPHFLRRKRARQGIAAHTPDHAQVPPSLTKRVAQPRIQSDYPRKAVREPSGISASGNDVRRGDRWRTDRYRKDGVTCELRDVQLPKSVAETFAQQAFDPAPRCPWSRIRAR